MLNARQESLDLLIQDAGGQAGCQQMSKGLQVGFGWEWRFEAELGANVKGLTGEEHLHIQSREFHVLVVVAC